MVENNDQYVRELDLVNNNLSSVEKRLQAEQQNCVNLQLKLSEAKQTLTVKCEELKAVKSTSDEKISSLGEFAYGLPRG